jgi:uncharacterized membrane protein
MKALNPLQMNNWEIKKFLTVVLAIQIVVWGLIGLDAIGLRIPIVREFFGFIYLTFIPGILILRVLKLHKLDNIETLLYSVGLSVATLMLSGVFINTFYPLFGISGPFSIIPLIITISIIVLVLGILSYVRDKDFSDPSFIDVNEVLSPPALFLCLVPFLSILGTYLFNFYNSIILLMFLIFIIGIIALLIGFDKFIPKNLYPLAVFVIAISLLFSKSLISMYIWGWDIPYELYYSNLIVTNSIWDPAIGHYLNAMLSIIIFAPIYSIVTNMSVVWVFKIIYSLLFSLVPLGMYQVVRKQSDNKIAFLSAFFFMSIYTFYAEMPQLARQEMAELFLVLLILLMISGDMNKLKRAILLIVFGFSLVVSHYALSYIYLFSLISAWLIVALMNIPIFSRIENRAITSTFVLILTTLTLTWYMYVSSSCLFHALIHVHNHITSSIFTDFLNPEKVEGLKVILTKIELPLHKVHKYLHLLSQFFIFVGVVTVMLKPKEMKFKREYMAFSLVNLAICIATITIPYVGSTLNTSRVYHITLIFLAPFCVIGAITICKFFYKVIRIPWTNEKRINSLKVFSIFLVILLLFSTEFIYIIAKDRTSTLGDYPRFNEQEVLGAKWLNNVKSGAIYADYYRTLLSTGFNGMAGRYIPEDSNKIERNAYIIVGKYNIINNLIKIGPNRCINTSEITKNRDKIYDSLNMQIHRS